MGVEQSGIATRSSSSSLSSRLQAEPCHETSRRWSSLARGDRARIGNNFLRSGLKALHLRITEHVPDRVLDIVRNGRSGSLHELLGPGGVLAPRNNMRCHAPTELVLMPRSQLRCIDQSRQSTLIDLARCRKYSRPRRRYTAASTSPASIAAVAKRTASDGPAFRCRLIGASESKAWPARPLGLECFLPKALLEPDQTMTLAK